MMPLKVKWVFSAAMISIAAIGFSSMLSTPKSDYDPERIKASLSDPKRPFLVTGWQPEEGADSWKADTLHVGVVLTVDPDEASTMIYVLDRKKAEAELFMCSELGRVGIGAEGGGAKELVFESAKQAVITETPQVLVTNNVTFEARPITLGPEAMMLYCKVSPSILEKGGQAEIGRDRYCAYEKDHWKLRPEANRRFGFVIKASDEQMQARQAWLDRQVSMLRERHQVSEAGEQIAESLLWSRDCPNS